MFLPRTAAGPLRLDRDRETLEAATAAMPIQPDRVHSAMVLVPDGAVLEPVQSRAMMKGTAEGNALGADANPLRAGVSCWRRGRPPAHIMGPTGRQARARSHALRPRRGVRTGSARLALPPMRGRRPRYPVLRGAVGTPGFPKRPTTQSRPRASWCGPCALVGTVTRPLPWHAPCCSTSFPTNGLARHKTLVAARGDQDNYLCAVQRLSDPEPGHHHSWPAS